MVILVVGPIVSFDLVNETAFASLDLMRRRDDRTNHQNHHLANKSQSAHEKRYKVEPTQKTKQQVTKSSSTNPDARSWEIVQAHPEGIKAETKVWRLSEAHHQHPICSSVTVSKDSNKSDP